MKNFRSISRIIFVLFDLQTILKDKVMVNERVLDERFRRLENLLLLQKKKLTLKEASLYTGYKESYLYKLTSCKKIPHSKPCGGSIFFDRDELEEWLSRNRVNTSDEIEEEADKFIL